MDHPLPVINTDELVAQIGRMLDGDRPIAARALLQAAHRRCPADARLQRLRARLLAAEGQPDAALGELDDAVGAAPADAALRLARAQIHVGRGDLRQALAESAEAVLLEPASATAKARLGILLSELGRTEDAIACLNEALAGQPQASTCRALAMAQDRAGRSDVAAATIVAGLAAWPRDRDLRAAGVLLAIRRREFGAAVALAPAARNAGAVSAEIFSMMGHALASLDRHDEAAEAYRLAASLAPHDRSLLQIASISRAAGAAERTAPRELRRLFEECAPNFERHILSLGYRVPGLMRVILEQRGPLPCGPVLDLGCGTGLLAVALGELAGPITGFDLSPAMLEAARAKQLYAELHEGDLLDLLAAESRCWPVILAADVLTYFAALEPLLRAVHQHLAPGGCFIFSLEELVPDAEGAVPGNGRWALGRMGCHAHGRDYIAQALRAAGFTGDHIERQRLRDETDGPVSGWIVVAEHLPAPATSSANRSLPA